MLHSRWTVAIVLNFVDPVQTDGDLYTSSCAAMAVV